jgi:nitrogen regulatory protein P-II 1
MKMILFILHDATKLSDLLNAWQEAGATGATVLFSTGMGRIHHATTLRDDLPLMPSLSDFYEHDEKLSRTLFSVVKDYSTAMQVRDATCRVVGDLNQPETGFLIILPVDQVEGMDKQRDESK